MLQMYSSTVISLGRWQITFLLSMSMVLFAIQIKRRYAVRLYLDTCDNFYSNGKATLRNLSLSPPVL